MTPWSFNGEVWSTLRDPLVSKWCTARAPPDDLTSACLLLVAPASCAGDAVAWRRVFISWTVFQHVNYEPDKEESMTFASVPLSTIGTRLLGFFPP